MLLNSSLASSGRSQTHLYDVLEKAVVARVRGRELTVKGHDERLPGERNYFVIVVVISDCMYLSKNHQSVHLKLVNFIVFKFIFTRQIFKKKQIKVC